MNPIAGQNATTPNETTTPSGSKPESSSEPTPLQNEGESTLPSAVITSETPLTVKRLRRENVREKAQRILVSGRLRVVKVDGDLIIATCKGDSGELYHLGYDPTKRQHRCTCAARGPCSHQYALWSVTAVER